MQKVIEIASVSKTYKNALENSLNNVSFSIEEGSKVGIFGPNGAGKTTLISIICGILPASSGEVIFTVDNKTLERKEILPKLGYIPQDYSFYEELSPYQNLKYFGALYNIPKHILDKKIDDLLNVLGLLKVKHKKVAKFSGGMKRRVNLAIGIINDPDILFLDEPTVGVDVQSKNAIISYLEELNQKGTTIVYTSHHMNEAQEFCNQIILMDKGNLIESDSLEHLLQKYNDQNLEQLFLRLTGVEYRD